MWGHGGGVVWGQEEGGVWCGDGGRGGGGRQIRRRGTPGAGQRSLFGARFVHRNGVMGGMYCIGATKTVNGVELCDTDQRNVCTTPLPPTFRSAPSCCTNKGCCRQALHCPGARRPGTPQAHYRALQMGQWCVYCTSDWGPGPLPNDCGALGPVTQGPQGAPKTGPYHPPSAATGPLRLSGRQTIRLDSECCIIGRSVLLFGWDFILLGIPTSLR